MRKYSLIAAVSAVLLAALAVHGADAGYLISENDIESKKDKNSYVLREFRKAAERSALYVVGGKHRDNVLKKDAYSLKNLAFLAPYVKNIPRESNLKLPKDCNLGPDIDRFLLRVTAMNSSYRDFYSDLHADCKSDKCAPANYKFQVDDDYKDKPLTASQVRSLNGFLEQIKEMNKLSAAVQRDLDLLEREIDKSKSSQRAAERKKYSESALLGSSPLIAAAADGSGADLVRTIKKEKERLKDKFSIDATNNMGDTALIGLCRNNKTGNLSPILKEKPDVNITNRNGETAVMLAARTNNPTLLNQMLKLNPDLNKQNNKGETALHYACSADADKTLKILLSRNADAAIADKSGLTPLAYSAVNAKPNCLTVFMADANFSAPLSDGKTVLQLLMASHNLDVIKSMMEKLKINDRVYPGGEAAVHVAAKEKFDGSVALFESLSAAGADLNQINNNAETPLHLAVSSDNVPLAKFLLDQKVNVEIQTNDGKLAGDLAKSVEMKKLFEAPKPTVTEAPKAEAASEEATEEEPGGLKKLWKTKKWWIIGIGGGLLLLLLMKK